MGKGWLWVISFIYKYETSTTHPLYETTQCFILINKWYSWVQFTLPTIRVQPHLICDKDELDVIFDDLSYKQSAIINCTNWKIAYSNTKYVFVLKQSSLFSFYALPSGGKSKGAVVHWVNPVVEMFLLKSSMHKSRKSVETFYLNRRAIGQFNSSWNYQQLW